MFEITSPALQVLVNAAMFFLLVGAISIPCHILATTIQRE